MPLVSFDLILVSSYHRGGGDSRFYELTVTRVSSIHTETLLL
jgi:hypothetical protein